VQITLEGAYLARMSVTSLAYTLYEIGLRKSNDLSKYSLGNFNVSARVNVRLSKRVLEDVSAFCSNQFQDDVSLIVVTAD